MRRSVRILFEVKLNFIFQRRIIQADITELQSLQFLSTELVDL